jgi:hypothetical protein
MNTRLKHSSLQLDEIVSVYKVGVWIIMFEIKACAVSEKCSPVGYRDEFFRNKRNAEIGHYGQTLDMFTSLAPISYFLFAVIY